jgi:hypothetical protein
MKIIVKIGLETDGDYLLMNFNRYGQEFPHFSLRQVVG